MFTRLLNFVRQVIRRMIRYKDIETVEYVETPLSNEMADALDEWYNMYLNKADWLKPDTVKSLNLPAFISSEIARQIVLEMKWSITGKGKDGETQTEDGNDIMNPRAEYLKAEFEKCITVLRQKLEQGCAAGGMVIKPYPKDGHIYFDYTMDWSLYPIAFDDDGNLADVIFRDTFSEGKTVYPGLYAHYQYYGEIYGPNIPVFEDDSGVPTKFFSPKDVKKHPTGRPLQHATDVNPLAGPFWFERMKADRLPDIVQEAKNVAGVK